MTYREQIEYIKIRGNDLADSIATGDWVDVEIRAKDIARLANELNTLA